MRHSYSITGMHCTACVTKITSSLKKTVSSVHVTLDPPRVVLEDGVLPPLTTLNRIVSEAGQYILKAEAIDSAQEEPKSWIKTYYPLFLIVGLISLVSIAGSAHCLDWMLHFMAGFYIVFSFFKLLDIHGFKDAYASYDLLAKHWNTYGFIYPFLELSLGFAFLFRFKLIFALCFSILLMGFSSFGVIQALREKRKIRCACLGTVLNLPMSTITLVEDLAMIVMSILMLVQH